MLSFPGEDSIMARAIDAHCDGFETPGFGEHRHGCPCHDMTEEEYDEETAIPASAKKSYSRTQKTPESMQ